MNGLAGNWSGACHIIHPCSNLSFSSKFHIDEKSNHRNGEMKKKRKKNHSFFDTERRGEREGERETAHSSPPLPLSLLTLSPSVPFLSWKSRKTKMYFSERWKHSFVSEIHPSIDPGPLCNHPGKLRTSLISLSSPSLPPCLPVSRYIHSSIHPSIYSVFDSSSADVMISVRLIHSKGLFFSSGADSVL